MLEPASLALAHPVFAIVGGLLVILFLWLVFKRLMRLAIWFGIAAVVLWAIFIAG